MLLGFRTIFSFLLILFRHCLRGRFRSYFVGPSDAPISTLLLVLRATSRSRTPSLEVLMFLTIWRQVIGLASNFFRHYPTFVLGVTVIIETIGRSDLQKQRSKGGGRGELRSPSLLPFYNLSGCYMLVCGITGFLHPPIGRSG